MNTITLPEAVTQLEDACTQAQSCAGIIKGYGTAAQVVRGRKIYGRAKANTDGVIAGLIAALTMAQAPDKFPLIAEKLQNGVSSLAKLAKLADSVRPDMEGCRGIFADISSLVKDLSGPYFNKLVDAAMDFYRNRQSHDAFTREKIITLLEAARWPEFDEVKPAQ